MCRNPLDVFPLDFDSSAGSVSLSVPVNAVVWLALLRVLAVGALPHRRNRMLITEPKPCDTGCCQYIVAVKG